MLTRILVALTLGTLFSPVALSAPPVVESVELLIGSWLPEEGGPNPRAQSPLRSPFGVDFDRSGNMLIVELEGGRIHEWTPNGALRVVSGDGSKSYRGDGGPLAQATYNGMHNVAVTQAGKMYVADSWNHCIREVDLATRAIRTLAGTGTAGFSGDGGPAAEAKFDFLMCVTLNTSEDRLFVADLKNLRIRAVDLDNGTVHTVAGNGAKGTPTDGSIAINSPLVDPRAVTVDSQNRIYILERGGHALRRVDPDGTIRTVAGTGARGFRDGPALEAQLGSPKHVCVDKENRIYIADDVNAAIRCYDPQTETVSTLLGRGFGERRVQLSRPHGVCIENGDLYAVDTGHDRIFRVRFTAGK